MSSIPPENPAYDIAGKILFEGPGLLITGSSSDTRQNLASVFNCDISPSSGDTSPSSSSETPRLSHNSAWNLDE